MAGYLQDHQDQAGRDGRLAGHAGPEQNYKSRTAGSVTVYPINSETRYRNDNGTGGQTTSYAYTFASGSVRPESVTTTLPTVTTAQNGPNAAASIDDGRSTRYGRPTWAKDADGFIHATEYDAATGAVTKRDRRRQHRTSSNEPLRLDDAGRRRAAPDDRRWWWTPWAARRS